MTGKLPINIDHLLRQRTIEGEHVEYKAGWNPQSVLHTIRRRNAPKVQRFYTRT
jgi:ATP-dependent DNA helicase RecG